MEELRTVAEKFGYKHLYKNLVDDWIAGAPADLDESRGNDAPETSSAVAEDSELKITLGKMSTAIADLAASIRDSSMNAARQGEPPTARPAQAAADAPDEFQEQPAHAEEQAAPPAGAAGGPSGGKPFDRHHDCIERVHVDYP